MESVRKLDYLEFLYEAESGIFCLKWNEKSGDLSLEEYMESGKIFKEVYADYSGKPVLHDMRNFDYVIAPETQEWIANEIMADLVRNYELRKMAFILPKDNFFAAVSTEQAVEDIEEAADSVFQPKYFDNPEEGIIWLKS